MQFYVKLVSVRVRSIVQPLEQAENGNAAEILRSAKKNTQKLALT
jgi:hypothetical protein